MSVPPGDTARSGHCSSGVCALCPRAVGQGATLDACVHVPAVATARARLSHIPVSG